MNAYIRKLAAGLTLGCLFFCSPCIVAQTNGSNVLSPQRIAIDSDERISSIVTKLIDNPTVFNAFVNQFTNSGWNTSHSNAVISIINDLHLRPKVFHASGGADSAAFGLEYDYNKSLQNKTLNPDSINPAGLSFNIFAKGTIADNAGKNPDNFLESGFKLHLYQAIGGMTPQIITGKSELEIRDELKDKAAQSTSDDESDPAVLSASKVLMQYCRPQFSYDIAAHGTLESDQTFDNKQWTYGGMASVVYQDWTGDSPYTWLNVLDIPFAAIRSFTSKSGKLSFKPSGLSFPVLIGGVDLVDPANNTSRLAVDPNAEAYARFRAEVVFKTEVIHMFGTDIWLSASYRYFREINPSSLIKIADMNEFNYFVARLDLPKGFNISYSTGKLPIDRKSDQVYAIGYSLNF